ncbi:MAG: hypothetical protein RID09_27515 [Coleofasciculus sp. G1-WW12-02]|uniref:hypothetical protein n=1 Tax=Coleofasciculus sp. G1-WW12-02 TaxID=3068483 RepID=UPI0032F1C058
MNPTIGGNKTIPISSAIKAAGGCMAIRITPNRRKKTDKTQSAAFPKGCIVVASCIVLKKILQPKGDRTSSTIPTNPLFKGGL